MTFFSRVVRTFRLDKVLHLFSGREVVSAEPLQAVSALSTIVFAISCGYEVLFINRLHISQYFLIAILQVAIATWAIAELKFVTGCDIDHPLKSLKFVLWAQLLVIFTRHIYAFFFELPAHFGRHQVDGLLIESSAAFIVAYLFIFLSINNSLISCFSYAEKNRVNQLDDARQELTRKLRTSLVAAGIAHEINQPLSTILLNIDMAVRELDGQYPPSVTDLQLRLGQILADSNRVVSTIETMRNLLRNVQTAQSLFDISTAVKTTLLSEKSLLDSRHVLITTSGLNFCHQLFGDRGQMQIAVSNLVRNTVEALAGAGTSNPQLTVTLSATRSDIILKLADNGPGFPVTMRENDFLVTTKPHGTGLGLYLARVAVENNGGVMHLGCSKLLGGAEVTLVFPARSTAPRPPG